MVIPTLQREKEMIIDTDEKLQSIVKEILEHGAIWSTDKNGIIKKGSMLIHMSKDNTPIFECEQAAMEAALVATMKLRAMGYSGDPIWSKGLDGFGVQVGDKLDG
jgi:hypothetical protein